MKLEKDLKPGDTVIVTLDDGRKYPTTARSVPWKLGGHTWVIQLENFSGCFLLSRVRRATKDGT